MSERTNTAATNSRDAGVLQGPQAPNAPTACNFVRILPVRFALSSEEAPPVGEAGLPAYMRAVEEKKNLKYTLRLLRNGFVHVYHATDDKFSWQVKDGTIEQIGMCPYSSAEDKSSYIRLPEDWGKAYIAFSNAPPEDFWPQYLGNGELVLSRFHEVTWEKGAKGISSPSTLCGAPEKLAEWVEEFRKEPGFVRALFEYEDTTVLEYFDPELGHFKPTTFPEAINKRWRRTRQCSHEIV